MGQQTSRRATAGTPLPFEATFLLLAEWAYRKQIVTGAGRKHTIFGEDGTVYTLIPHEDEIIVLAEENEFASSVARSELPKVIQKLGNAERQLQFLVQENAEQQMISDAQQRLVDARKRYEEVQEAASHRTTREWRFPTDLSNLKVSADASV